MLKDILGGMKNDEGDLDFSTPSNNADLVEPTEPAVILENETEPVDPVEPTEPTELSPEPSSLTNEPVPVEPVKPEFTDEIAFGYLSEKLGREVKSYEDLVEIKDAENPLDKDPYLKNLYEWRQRTGRPIEDYSKYQRDLSSLDDLSVARELLKHEYPTLTEEEINFEINSKFLASEEDLEEDSKLKSLELKKYATKGRQVLESLKADLGESLIQNVNNITPEQQAELDFAKQVRESVQANEAANQEYKTKLSESISQMESIKVVLGDDKEISYTLNDEVKNTLAQRMEEMSHWKNEDGSWNHTRIVEDAIKSLYMEDMTKLAFQQGVAEGTDKTITDTKNVTLGQRDTMPNINSGDGVVIEGLDKMLGNGRPTFKRRK